ncbi:MAG: hypothetical protein ACM3KF_03010 [Acidobacteriota bacterium]
MKIFGHEFGKKPETPEQTVPETQEAAPVVTTEVTPTVVPEVEQTTPAPEVAHDLGAASVEAFAARIADEAAATGSMDVPSTPATPKAPTVAETVAAIDAANTAPDAEANDTFAVPAASEVAEVPNVPAMQSEEIFAALNIPSGETAAPVETPTEALAEPATPEQTQL